MAAFLLFDLIVLAVLVIFTLRGAWRGLVLSLCSLLAVVVAFAGASFLARTVSPMVAQALGMGEAGAGSLACAPGSLARLEFLDGAPVLSLWNG